MNRAKPADVASAGFGHGGQGRLLWAMAHEFAHQGQFGAWDQCVPGQVRLADAMVNISSI